MMTNLANHDRQDAHGEPCAIPVRTNGEPLQLSAGRDCRPYVDTEGVSITDEGDRFAAWSDRTVKTPLTIEAVMRTDSTNIRLKYGELGQLVLNWEVQPGTLVASNPATGHTVWSKGVGGVPTNEWVTVRWEIGEARMTLFVNGEKRYAARGNFAGLDERIGLASAWGATVTIREVKLEESVVVHDGRSDGERHLPGLEPDEEAPGLIGCLAGVLHYRNSRMAVSAAYVLTGAALQTAAVAVAHAPTIEQWGRQVLADGAHALGIEPIAASGEPVDEVRGALDRGIPCLVFDEELQDYALLTGDRADGFALRVGRSIVWRPWRALVGSRTWMLHPRAEADPLTAFKLAVDRLTSAAGTDGLCDSASTGAWRRALTADTPNAERYRVYGALLAHCKLHAKPYMEDLGRFAGRASALFDEAADAMEEAGRALLEAVTAGCTQDAAALQDRAAVADAIAFAVLVRLQQALGMRRELPNVQFQGFHMSHVGALRACTYALPVEPVDNAWLFGATGYAFVMVTDDRLSNRGPTFGLPNERIHGLARNIGLEIDGIRAATDERNHRQVREAACTAIRRAIDEGKPCFGQGLDEHTETTVIVGYEPDGFYTHGWHQRGLPIPWETLGGGYCPCEPCSARRQEEGYDVRRVTFGFIDVHWAGAVEPADALTTVREAFGYALALHDGSDPDLRAAGYHYGPAAYEHWIRIVREGNAIGFHIGYLCDTWRECRSHASAFLRQAADKLGGEWAAPLERAAKRYDASAELWRRLNEMYPWMQPRTEVVDVEKRRLTLELLRGIAAEEESGMGIIGAVYRNMA